MPVPDVSGSLAIAVGTPVSTCLRTDSDERSLAHPVLIRIRYGVYSYQYPANKPLALRINEAAAREFAKKPDMTPTTAFIKHQKMLAEEPQDDFARVYGWKLRAPQGATV